MADVSVPRNFESGVNEFTDVGAELVQIKMRDSRGYRTVRDYSPFRSVFGAVTRSWECPHDLPENAHYILDVQITPVPTGLSNIDIDLRTQLAVTMIGWREVTL